MSWDRYISEGIASVQRSDHAAAEASFKQALRFAKQNFKRTDNRLALTLSLLGHMYFHNVDFRQAELLLEQSLRLHSESETLNEPCVLMDVFSLGEIKLALGKRVDACRLYEKTIARLKAAEDGEQSDVLLQAARQLQQLLDRNMALLSYTERLELVQPELIQSILNAAAEQTQDAQTASGGAEENEALGPETRSLTDAEKLSEDALSMTGTRSISEVWSMQLNTGLSALSKEDDERESWVAAYLNLESALRLARRMFDAGDARLTQSLKALADASSKLMMYEQAEFLYRDAIAASKQESGSVATKVEALRLSLAVFYAESDRFAQAKKILDATKVPDDLQLTPEGRVLLQRIEKANERIAIYHNSQNLLRQAQDAEEKQELQKAAKLANTALSTLRQAFAPDHPEHARLLRYRSSLLRSLGEVEQSDELVKRAERIERANNTVSGEWEKITQELPKPDFQQVPA